MTALKSQNELFGVPQDENKGVTQDAADVWLKFLEIVKLYVSDLKFNTWFKPISAKSLENDTLLITVPSQDYYEMIISRFGDIISRALKMILGDPGRLIYEIEKDSAVKIENPSVKKNESRGNSPTLFENFAQTNSTVF